MSQEFIAIWNTVYNMEGVLVFDASLHQSCVLIDNILIRKTYRRKGVGSDIIKLVCEFADKFKLDIILLPDSSFGTPKDVLIRFYNNFGFLEHNENFYMEAFSDYLLRKPK